MNSNNIINQVAYLRTSREFPEDLHMLALESNKSYLDIANAVNNRIIALYPSNRPAINGEGWFFKNQRQQALRQLYVLPSGTVNNTTINLGFKLSSIYQISKNSYGSFTDGTNWYGIIYGSNVVIAGQYSFYLKTNTMSPNSDQIVILVDAGAPSFTSGTIVIEWISNV